MRRKDHSPSSLWLQGLVRESLTVLCRNALPFDRKVEIEGLLCVTVDDQSVITVNVNEVISKQHQPTTFSSSFNLLKSMSALPACCQTTEQTTTEQNVERETKGCCGRTSEERRVKPVHLPSSNKVLLTQSQSQSSCCTSGSCSETKPKPSVTSKCECSADCPCCDKNFNCQGPQPLHNALDLSVDRSRSVTPSSSHSDSPVPAEYQLQYSPSPPREEVIQNRSPILAEMMTRPLSALNNGYSPALSNSTSTTNIPITTISAATTSVEAATTTITTKQRQRCLITDYPNTHVRLPTVVIPTPDHQPAVISGIISQQQSDHTIVFDAGRTHQQEQNGSRILHHQSSVQQINEGKYINEILDHIPPITAITDTRSSNTPGVVVTNTTAPSNVIESHANKICNKPLADGVGTLSNLLRKQTEKHPPRCHCCQILYERRIKHRMHVRKHNEKKRAGKRPHDN